MTVPAAYRTFWPRFWAGLLDSLLLFLVLPIDSWVEDATTNPYLLGSWFIVYTFIFDAYSVTMHARFGQTVGKMVTGVKVLDLSGAKLSLRQALMRDSVPILLGVVVVLESLPRILNGGGPYAGVEFTWIDYVSVLWFAVEVVTMLLNAKRRAVHDYLAHSIVVRLSALQSAVVDKAAA